MSTSADIAEKLEQGWRNHQAGDFARAENVYRQGLEADGSRADVWYLLGAATHAQGKRAEAADCFRQALQLRPDYGDARNFLAIVMVELGRFDEAVGEFRRAIALNPGDAELRYNLGLAFKKRGDLAEACAAWKIALELKPDHKGAQRGLREAQTTSGVGAAQAEASGITVDRLAGLSGDDLGLLLDGAWQAHLAGELSGAEAAYRRALEIKPDQADVWYLLGAVLHSLARPAEAIDCFSRALDLQPGYADAHNYLGVTLVALGRHGEAVGEFRRATAARADDAELHVNLGLALRRFGQPNDALNAFRRALQLRPDHVKAQSHLRKCLRMLRRYDDLIESYRQSADREPTSPAALHRLGLALMEAKRYPDAIDAFQRALALDPDSTRIRNNIGLALAGADRLDDAIAVYREALRLKPDLAEAHNNLGVALGKQRHTREAIAHYCEALRILPDFAAAHANLGGLLGNEGQHQEAESRLRRAIELRPSFPEAHCNLGAVLLQLGRLDEAEAALRRALELNSEFVEAHANLGGLLATRGDLPGAEACYSRALQIDPKFPGARYNRSLLLLSQGRLSEGWEEYEFRFQCDEFKGRVYREPRWDGTPFAGRTLLVHAEQGLGDSLQFVRYLPLLERDGGRIVFLCPPRLVDLVGSLEGCVEIVAERKLLPPVDFQVPLMNLPRLLHTSLESIPNAVPYLKAEPSRVEAWRARLSAVRELKIGIAWQGNPKHKGDRYRSIPLAAFEGLARLGGVRLFSLQKDHGHEQRDSVSFADAITDLSRDDHTILDTAAILENLDLLICCDTSLAHLAGALARPAWVALGVSPDWRWLLNREDSPWYPTLRLFRQRRAGDWHEVFDRIVSAVRELAANRRG